MLKNYFNITWRVIMRAKLFSLINISGLSLGLASCVLIGYYIQEELTYDQFHLHADRIYRVSSHFINSNGGDNISATPDRLGLQLQSEFPEVKSFARLNPFNDHVVKYNGEKIIEKGFSTADPQTLQIFNYTFIEGNPATALNNRNDVIVSESIAKKYFGSDHALGKTMEIDNNVYVVTAIFKDLQKNTSLPENALISADFAKNLDARWSFNCKTFLLMNENFNRKSFEEKLKVFTKKHFPDLEIAFELEPLTDLHFSSGVKFDGPKGNKNYLFGFAFAGVVLLLIVIFNYINLSALLISARAKEFGMRKVSGANSGQLIGQFLCESLLVLLISGALALGFIQLILPTFTMITGKTIDFTWGADLSIVAVLLVSLICVVLVAFIYPARLVAAGKSVVMLKGNFTLHSGNNRHRSILLIVQFGLCTAVFISLVVILMQMQFIRTKELGYHKENILSINLPSDSTSRLKLNALSNQLYSAGFKNQSFGTSSCNLFEANQMRETITLLSHGEKIKMQVNAKVADENFIDLMKMHISSGREFKDYSSRQWTSLVMVNETFMHEAGWETGTDHVITLPYGQGDRKVIGVIKDFHFTSLYNPIEPMILFAEDFHSNQYEAFGNLATLLYLRASPNQLADIKKAWNATFPDSLFDYHFLEDDFEAQYENEANMIALLLYFAVLSMIVTGLGLYSIAAYQVEQRTKEIGIRKILGANVKSLFILLSKDNLKRSVIGGILGLGIAWKMSDLWLSNFSYKIEISIFSLLLPTLLMLIFAGFIVGYTIVRVASTNPVESLRNE